jgi:transketolase
MRNAIRMAALMGQQVIHVFTHDSIGLGEDGPTHQPVEQLSALRSTPNLSTWRPADAVETAAAWQAALDRRDGPSALVLSRQSLPYQQRDAQQQANISRGGYILRHCEGVPELILIATGSEVGIAMDAADGLQGKAVRVVSMPSCDIFDAQDEDYRQAVLPNTVRARIAIEAGHSDGWFKYVGLDGLVIGMESFGESAPADDLFRTFGFTVENLTARAKDLLNH